MAVKVKTDGDTRKHNWMEKIYIGQVMEENMSTEEKTFRRILADIDGKGCANFCQELHDGDQEADQQEKGRMEDANLKKQKCEGSGESR